MPVETEKRTDEQPRSEGHGRANAGGMEGYLRLAGTALLYFVAGMAGLAVPFTSGNVSPVWPASGVALACLLLFGWRCWPAVAVAEFLVNFFSPIPSVAAVGLALGNTGAALTGAFLLRRLPGFRPSLASLRDTLGLVVLAAAVSSNNKRFRRNQCSLLARREAMGGDGGRVADVLLGRRHGYTPGRACAPYTATSSGTAFPWRSGV